MSVQLSSHFGIVLRKSAVEKAGLSRERLLDLMEAAHPADEDESLFSFGPHFGEEAAQTFERRLIAAGLVYPDDFFVVDFDVPGWLALCGSVMNGRSDG